MTLDERIKSLRQRARERAAFDYDQRRPAKDFPEWKEANRLQAEQGDPEQIVP